jgi:uncharacterized phiE125 gp8 family phage protein
MKTQRTIAPASQIITVAEAAKQVFGDVTYDSVKLTRDIIASTKLAEDYCERSFLTQTWEMKLDDFPDVNRHNPKGAIHIPRGKVQSITSFGYYDLDGALITLAAGTDYYLDDVGEVSRLVPTSALNGWPTVDEFLPNAVSIVWVSGYADTLPADKEDIVSACMVMIGDLYEFRQDHSTVQVYKTKIFETLLNDYKIYFDFSLNDA